jgi:tetratricopeptide (TPR) repeat protein
MDGGERSGFAYNALGCHLAMSDKFDEAVVCFSKAVELEEGNAAYYQNLGLACEKMSLFEQAVQAYEKMAAIDPEAALLARDRLRGIGATPARVH